MALTRQGGAGTVMVRQHASVLVPQFTALTDLISSTAGWILLSEFTPRRIQECDSFHEMPCRHSRATPASTPRLAPPLAIAPTTPRRPRRLFIPTCRPHIIVPAPRLLGPRAQNIPSSGAAGITTVATLPPVLLADLTPRVSSTRGAAVACRRHHPTAARPPAGGTLRRPGGALHICLRFMFLRH